jgi:hypothetical protein
MALLTYKEFAAKCGITTGNLSNYIKRKNVVASGEFIDDTFGKNADFLRKRQAKMGEKPSIPAETVELEPVSAPVQPPAVINSPAKGDKPAKAPKVTVSKEAQDKYALELQKEAEELKKLQETNRYLKIKADKAEGILIPTEAVKLLFLQYSKAITNNFRNSLEGMVELLAFKYNLSAQDIADLRREGIDKINAAVSEAIEEAKSGLVNIVDEYSETKGKGERN